MIRYVALLCLTVGLTAPAAAGSLSSTQEAPSANEAIELLRDAKEPPSNKILGVVLESAGSNTTLHASPGALAYTNAFATVLVYLDYPGQHAEVRTHQRKPTIYVRTEADPANRLYLVKLESNKRTRTRSVKMGRSGFGTISGITAPDSAWTVPFSAHREAADIWKITLNVELKPGEYGLLIPTVVGGQLIPGNAQLYAFGIDK